jgi:protein PhnA
MIDLNALTDRAEGACELCRGTDGLTAHPVAPRDAHVLVCATCSAELAAEPLNPTHWFCLQESAWSPEPAVQVVAWRLLGALDASWATDLRDQLYLDDDTAEWASDTGGGDQPVDCNGVVLRDGDSVTLIKDLNVKGGGFTAKRGTLVKNIRTGADPTHVEGRVNKVAIYLKCEFLKRA